MILIILLYKVHSTAITFALKFTTTPSTVAIISSINASSITFNLTLMLLATVQLLYFD